MMGGKNDAGGVEVLKIGNLTRSATAAYALKFFCSLR